MQAPDDSTMLAFRRAAGLRAGSPFTSSAELHRWSVDEPAAFWSLVWDFFGVVGERGDLACLPSVLPEATFFPQSRLNLAENLLAPWEGGNEAAALFVREVAGRLQIAETVTGRELCRRVASFAATLRGLGIVPGDRIGLILPVGPDALACTLGALAVGAVVSSVAPEFGAPSIIDRLGQLEPSVLVVAPTYRWNGREHRRSANVVDVLSGLPTLRAVFVTENDDEVERSYPGVQLLSDALGGTHALEFTRLPFDHPAYILFSSGTTGKPKCLVHRAGGVLVKHLVELGLHADVRTSDRLLYYSTTSWMMWNWQVSCLALGATLVLFDGAPTYPSPLALIDAATIAETTHLGLSARLLDHLRSEAADVGGHLGSQLRQVLVTGSPLSVTTAEWLMAEAGPQVMVNPISGGTDLVGCFVGGDPTRTFHPGEMTGPILGMAVDVFDSSGDAAADDEPGELVCTQPFPTVPVGIWGDDSGERLRETYFGVWLGVWVHGDRALRTSRGGFTILGRSDATLNVGGVRIGTAEIYAALADHPDVADSLAFGQEWEGDTRIVLLVDTPPGVQLDDSMRASIAAAIRSACSPRHVPSLIVQVSDVPRTQTGKISEVAARDAVHGREVAGMGALANPESLDEIVSVVGAAQQGFSAPGRA